MSLLFLIVKQAQYDGYIPFSFFLSLSLSFTLLSVLAHDDVAYAMIDVDGRN
jgi:hypothetical protein